MMQSVGVSPYEEKLTWNSLLTQAYQIYARRFWTLFRIGLPIGILTYVFGHAVRISVDRLLVSELQFGFKTRIALGIVEGFIYGVFYWGMSTIFFAAISTNLWKEIESSEDLPPLADAYSIARQRMGSLIAVGLLSWTLFWLGKTAVLFPLAVSGKVRVRSNAYWAISSITLLILGGLVSRLALAVPELMHDVHISLRQAFRTSLRKTENWELFFIFFLAKSAIVGYAVYWLVHRGFVILWSRTGITASLYDWLTWGVYISLGFMLEAPLFIAFAVLDREPEPKKQEAWSAPAIG